MKCIVLIACWLFSGTTIIDSYRFAAAAFSPGSATFDGDGDRLNFTSTMGMSGAGKVFTASFWVNTGNTANTVIVAQGRTGTGGTQWKLQIANTLVFVFGDSAGTAIVSGFGDPVITSNTWHHVMISFDTANSSNRHLYIDGANAADAWTAYTNAALALDRTNLYVGTDDDFGSDLDGCLAQVWIDDSYVDLSNSANRAKFYNAGPVNMGTDGNLTGAGTPNVYLRFVSGSLNVNSGTGGGTATVSGAVASGDCGTVE